ncbi:MAG TPA: TIGR01777 family oxidoreductase [Polyangiaceae bacterium]|nr:TIGR01777 family oxidoreductase [Polyangiaceae bacterium]
MPRVLVAGGSGFIGRALVAALTARGDRVTVLTRGEARAQENGVSRQHWDPTPDANAAFNEVYDVVINLAGEQAVGVRYSESVKAGILNSRVDSTRWLVRAIERAEEKPKVFVCASGTGFYGSTLSSARVDERAPAGTDFLALVCVAWEAAANGAAEFGVRVVNARIAPVLSEQGGAVESLLRPFRLFVGGPIGSGQQGFPWIHLDDQIAALLRACDDGALVGPVNFCAPEPVSNAELSRIIGELLRRPAFLKAPGFALKALFGDGAEPLLGGQFAVPRALESVGFEFRYADVRSALTAILRAQD